MKKIKKIIILLLLLFTLGFGVTACDKSNNGNNTVLNETYKVTLVLNNDSPNQEVEVEKGEKLSNVTTPTKAGCRFVGWYSDSELTKKYDFNVRVNSNLTLYAKWEETGLDPNVEYGIVENDLYIPTNLEFSKEAHTSAKHTTVNGNEFSSGSYATNFNNASEGTVISGIKYSCYRYGKSSESVIIKPDNSHYNEELYHGREGGLFNVTPFGGINKFEITYSAGNPESQTPTKPNVRFGKDDNCLDYVYFLEPTSTKTTTTIDVNLSMYQYFSINSGDYTCYVRSFSVDYDNDSTKEPVYEQASGDGKVRSNPIRYDKTLVDGQSKITAPIAYEYDASSNTYKVTETKEFTYYTANYVRNHTDVKADATITDPLEVCIYYTLFKRWPANYSTNVGDIQSLFGPNTRKVSKYSRTDGYCRAIPWNGDGVYYELDIDVDGSYSQSSRGVGRVVAWERGWTATGYDSSPVCIYTDDHYNTFIEYLNNGTWSNRFNAEGRIASISYSTAPTVTFTGFDANIVEGTGGSSTVDPGDDPVIDNYNHEDYYANFAPAEMINPNTAKWQQVTTYSGIVEDNAYALVTGTGTSTKVFYGSSSIRANNGVLELDESADYPSYDIEPFYFKKVSGGYIMYQKGNGYNLYYKYSGTKKNISSTNDESDATVWQVSFSSGSFILGYDNDSLQFNGANGNAYWRTYSKGSQTPITLYRFCDIRGAVAPEEPTVTVEYDNNYELVTSVNDLNTTDIFYLVNREAKICYTDLGSSKVDFTTLDRCLMVPTTALFAPVCFEKHTVTLDIDYDYYYIYFMIGDNKTYFNYDEDFKWQASFEEAMFLIDIDADGYTYIRIAHMVDGKPMAYADNNGTYYLGYDNAAKVYKYGNDKYTFGDFFATNYVYKKVEPKPVETYELVTSLSDINSEDGYVIYNLDTLRVLYGEFDYDYNPATKELEGETPFDGLLLYFEKYTINNTDYYAIYYYEFGTKDYIGCDKTTLQTKACEGAYLYQVEIASDGRIYISPVEFDSTGTPVQVMVDGQALYFGLNQFAYGFVPSKESIYLGYVDNYLYKVVPPTEE